MKFPLPVLVLMSVPMIVAADEGMYLFNDLPREVLKDRYDFVPTDDWATHLQRSSVRFNSGGSGSFISSDGLVLTNHHVASDTLAKLSTPDRNLIEDGFLAKTIDQEITAPDLELNQLIEMVDVTARVVAAVTASDAAEATAQRRAVIAEIESEQTDRTGDRCDVVTLFGGATYHLYRYRRFTDVRLVWAPETAAAFFGGDADNFEYPRYCLDATIMRVYEDGVPAKLNDFLAWSDTPVADGDLVFVSGHPGRTQRMFTREALEFLRDERLPYLSNYLRRREILLQQYRLGGAEAARRGRDDLFGIQNARKAYGGMLAGLQDPSTIATKAGAQDALLQRVRDNPQTAAAASAWDDVAKLQSRKAALLRSAVMPRSDVVRLAMDILLLGIEDTKPNGERLSEFGDAGRESLLQRLLSPAPLYEDLQTVLLADEIARLMEQRGGQDELIAEILTGRSPTEAAAAMIAQTRVDEVAYRQELIDGGHDAVLASQDPLMELARTLQPHYRQHRSAEEEVEEAEKQAYAKIAEAKNIIEGTTGYPDATFTLRLAYGRVAGYSEAGREIEPTTNYAGAFEHATEHAGQEDFDLPASWMAAKDSLNLATQLNFVCTADIIGGNSGSPVVNRAGQLVGLIFDGNIQSLTSDYLYTQDQARAVSVSGVGIREALRKIYDADDLAGAIGR